MLKRGLLERCTNSCISRRRPPLLEESNAILSDLASFGQSFPGSVGHECYSRKACFRYRPYSRRMSLAPHCPHKLNYYRNRARTCGMRLEWAPGLAGLDNMTGSLGVLYSLSSGEHYSRLCSSPHQSSSMKRVWLKSH